MKKMHFQPKSTFDKVLKARVDDYFTLNNISQSGGSGLHLKALFIMIGLACSYAALIAIHMSWLSALFAVFVLVQFKVLLAFNVMHDGGHQSFSSRKWLNTLACYSMDLLGGSSFIWKQKHNILHHTYTNIDKKDDDIDLSGIMRLSPEQAYKPWHKYQTIYAPFLYGFLSLYLLIYSDLKRIISGKFSEDQPIAGLHKKDVLFFVLSRIFYVTYTLLIPMLFYKPIYVIAYFLGGHFLFGLTLSIVFQLAHTVDETCFPTADDKGFLQDSWMEHQLKTTCDFAQGNKFVTFYCGGLNYQVEHHLFNKISHVHYPAISQIVKQTCIEFHQPYLVNAGFFHALKSHFNFLKKMSHPNSNSI